MYKGFRFGIVEDNNVDENDIGLIRVRLQDLDRGKKDSDLVICTPLLPIMINITPQIGERVLVLVENNYMDDANELSNGTRMYIGPVISNLDDIEFDGFRKSGGALGFDGVGQVKPDFNLLKNKKGMFPKQNLPKLIGRGDTDIFLEKNKILLRTNKTRILSDRKVYNKINQGIIQLDKQDKNVLNKIVDGKQIPLDINNTIGNNTNIKDVSVANVVSDLVTFISPTKLKDLNLYGEEFITEQIQKEINTQSQPIPYGDNLATLLELMIKVVLNHPHDFHGKSTSDSNVVDSDTSKDIEKLKEFISSGAISKFVNNPYLRSI